MNDLDEHTGFLIVRLRPIRHDLIIDNFVSLHALADAAGLEGLLEVMKTLNLPLGVPLIRAMPPAEILKLEAIARRSSFPPYRSLTDYWRLDLRDGAHDTPTALVALNALPVVDAAYPEIQGEDPTVDPTNDTYSGQQGYLDAAPVGIDARWAWTQPNGCGNGIRVVDVEQGWFLNHEDYVSKAPQLIVGSNRDGIDGYIGNHGTAVLGVMVADDNDRGIVGIAPLSGEVRCASHYDALTNTDSQIANAVVGALTLLSAGDILVIEFQTKGARRPAEYVDENFDAIRLASALGVIVVEAAGDGLEDLDALVKGGKRILNPAYPGEFRDSGAIMVGAAVETDPHDTEETCFGARVDCFGWGRRVVTCGYGDLDAGAGNDQTYTDKSLLGTSAATPIVAGAALIVQGMMEANAGTRLSPEQMRLILSDPTAGTQQGSGGLIGVMPNLKAIIEGTLGLSPDVYLRDNVGDDGSVPSTGGISASPDIIVIPSTVAVEPSEFGEGSGSEENNSLGFAVDAGQDNFIYVRMKNRGAADAANVTARVFWSEVATLVTPDLWTQIGVTDPIDVPRGDTLVVAKPITWAAADIPASGHYCFIGILDHPADPAPLTPPPTDWEGFRSFIRNQNNVAWRNFNVVDEIGAAGDGHYEACFLITNAPDVRRTFDFVIEQRIGTGLTVTLEVPLGILRPFVDDAVGDAQVDRDENVGLIELPRSQRLTIPLVSLPAAARFRCRFIVRDLATKAVPGNQISIHQYFEEEEVGRITWRFTRKRDPRSHGARRRRRWRRAKTKERG